MGKPVTGKKVIHARAKGIPHNLSIFCDTKVAALNALQADINEILNNEILPVQNEIKEIRATVKAFRKTDVERIEEVMETLKDTMIKLVSQKESRLKQILDFPYEMDVDSREDTSESDLSECEFVRPEVLNQPWWNHLEQSKYWKKRIGLNAHEEPSEETIDGQNNDEWEKMRKCQCKRFEVYVPPKLLVVGPSVSKELHPRLIFCDEPINENHDTADGTKEKSKSVVQ